MKILLTGASGFVGAHLALHLQRAGHDLLLLSRAERQGSDRLRWLRADFGEPTQYIAEVADFAPEAVFHLAWEGIPDFSEAASTKNVVASLRFLGTIGQLPSVRKVVGAGSCWEYGETQGPVDEAAAANPYNWFTWAKASVRDYLVRLAQERGFDWYWPRIFFVYGQGQRAQSLIPSVAAALRQGSPPDVRAPLATNDFVYVADVAEGMARCLVPSVPPGIYNLGSGEETRVLEVVRGIEAILHQTDQVTSAISLVASAPPRRGLVADVARSRVHLGWTAQTSLQRGLELYLGEGR